MAKQRVGRRKAICLDCGHEWWALEGKERPPRCTLHGCRGRNVAWADTISAAELNEIKKRTRAEILALGGQSNPEDVPAEPEPDAEPETTKPVKEDETMSTSDDLIDDLLAGEHTITQVTTNTPIGQRGGLSTSTTSTTAVKKPPKRQPAPKRTSSGKFAPKSTADKVDKEPARTEPEPYSSFEDAVNDAGNYRGFNPLFIIVLGGMALIGAFIFLRGKTGLLAPTQKITIIDKQDAGPAAEPVAEPEEYEVVYPGLRHVGGGGLFS